MSIGLHTNVNLMEIALFQYIEILLYRITIINLKNNLTNKVRNFWIKSYDES